MTTTKKEKLTNTVPYIASRDGVFQYQRRVPQSVKRNSNNFEKYFDSKSLFRRSLGTKDPSQLHAAANEVHRDFEERLAKALGSVRVKAAPKIPLSTGEIDASKALRKPTDFDFEAIADRYRRLIREPFEKLMLKAEGHPQSQAMMEMAISDLETDAERILKAIKTPGFTARGHDLDTDLHVPVDEAEYVVRNEGFDAAPGSEDYGTLVAAIRSGLLKGYLERTGLSSGEIIPALKRKASSEKGLTIREAVERYLSVREFPKKTQQEIQLALKQFEQLIGNRALKTLEKKDFHAFVKHLAEQVVGGKSARSVRRPMAPQSVKKRLGFLRSAINVCIDQGAYDGHNPAADIKIGAWVRTPDLNIMPKKRRFTIGELNDIFRHPWFTGCASPTNTHRPGSHRLTGAEFWVPVVALFTGCRASELGGLMLSEVRMDDLHPHLVIRDNKYRRTKGGYARLVPILDALLKLGFREYVEHLRTTRVDRLFPDWKCPNMTGDFDRDDAAWANARIIRAFNRTVVPAALGDRLLPGARREVTFHSFRGAFKGMLSGPAYSLNINTIHEVVGHAKSDLDERYLGDVPIEETYPAVQGCDYKGVKLPTSPPLPSRLSSSL